MKTNLMVTNTEIHFLPIHESHTHALSRDTKHLRLDGMARSVFTGSFFLTLKAAFHGLCGTRGALIRLHREQQT